MGLRSQFIEANKSRLRYVVLNDSDKLPEQIPETETEIRILVEKESRAKLIAVLGIEPYEPELGVRCEYHLPPAECFGDGKPLRLITKGTGYFPETFESRLLAGAHVHKDVYRPDVNDLLWIMMYEYLHHGVQFNQRHNDHFFKLVRERIGPKLIYKNPHTKGTPFTSRKPEDKPSQNVTA